MSSNKKVSIEEMASAISEAMEEYRDLAVSDMKSAIQKTATSVKNNIKSGAPVRTGSYKSSWSTKKTSEDSVSINYTVYSKNRYQLAHLLEKGHANRGGGRTKAYPHIAPAEEEGEEELQRLIEQALKG